MATEGNTGPLDLEAIKARIEQLVSERDEASAEAEGLHAGMREVALFRAANAQGCLGGYAVPLRAEVERLRVEVDYYKPIAENFMKTSAPLGRVLLAAQKVCGHPGYHPNHLGDCIGVLSEPSCGCGLADLRLAVSAFKAATANPDLSQTGDPA